MTRFTRTHYDVLGVARTASRAEIREAWRRLVAQYHPDRHGGNPLEELAHERVSELNAAWEELSDPERRARYDAALAGEPPPARPPTRDGGFVRRVVRLAAWLLVVLLLLRIGPLLARGVIRLFAGTTPLSGVAFLAVAVALLVFWWRRRRR